MDAVAARPGTDAPDDFDPLELTADASLNRLVVAGLPGVPAALAGRQAYAILSVDAVAAVCADRGVAAGRDSVADDLGAALRSGDPAARRAATDVAAELGSRLACVLATLHDPATARAQGWNPWRHAYLRHWAAVDEVHLAGGLLAGDAGPAVVRHTRAALARLGVSTRVALVPWPAWAALIGAVRRVEEGGGDVVGVDLGQSRAKTALVRAPVGRTIEMTPFPPARVPFEPSDHPTTVALDGFLEAVLASAAHDARRLGANVRAVTVSVACYLRHGRPQGERGVYANLPDLTAPPWRERLRALFGPPLAGDVALVHDGTAAAASAHVARDATGAVLVAGSALGVGFPPAGLPGPRVRMV
jgi:hypothetical protein